MTVSRPGPVRRAVVLPVEVLVDDDALRDRVGVVLVVGVEVGVLAVGDVRHHVRGAVVDRALDRLRVRVDQQLRRVEARARLGLVRPVHAVAVALAGPDAGQVAVPVERGALGQLDRASRVPSSSKRQSSTRSAFSEKSEKFVPWPSQVAPSGNGLPGPDLHQRVHCVRARLHGSSKSATSSTRRGARGGRGASRRRRSRPRGGSVAGAARAARGRSARSSGVAVRSGRSFERSNVSSACGSGISSPANAANVANSLRRPSRVASAMLGSMWSVKNWNGASRRTPRP